MENSQIPRYLFGLSTTFPPLSLFTPRNQDLVFCCQKEFPLWSKAAPSIFFFHRITMLHPRQSLQGRARAGGDEEGGEKAAQNVVLLEQTWRPPTGLITLTIPTNPLVDSVILMEQRLPLFGRTPPRLGPGWP